MLDGQSKVGSVRDAGCSACPPSTPSPPTVVRAGLLVVSAARQEAVAAAAAARTGPARRLGRRPAVAAAATTLRAGWLPAAAGVLLIFIILIHYIRPLALPHSTATAGLPQLLQSRLPLLAPLVQAGRGSHAPAAGSPACWLAAELPCGAVVLAAGCYWLLAPSPCGRRAAGGRGRQQATGRACSRRVGGGGGGGTSAARFRGRLVFRLHVAIAQRDVAVAAGCSCARHWAERNSSAAGGHPSDAPGTAVGSRRVSIAAGVERDPPPRRDRLLLTMPLAPAGAAARRHCKGVALLPPSRWLLAATRDLHIQGTSQPVRGFDGDMQSALVSVAAAAPAVVRAAVTARQGAAKVAAAPIRGAQRASRAAGQAAGASRRSAVVVRCVWAQGAPGSAAPIWRAGALDPLSPAAAGAAAACSWAGMHAGGPWPAASASTRTALVMRGNSRQQRTFKPRLRLPALCAARCRAAPPPPPSAPA